MRIRTAGAVLLGTAAIVLLPGVASAHTFSAADDCGGLSWAARDFESDPGQPNTIVVTVDGAIVYSDLNFGANDIGSRPWTPTADHTWSIVVNAPGTDHDYNPSSTQRACQPTTTSTTTTTSTVPKETTTSTSSTTTTTNPTTDLSSTSTSTPDPTSTSVADSGTTTAPTTVPAPTDPTPTQPPSLPSTGSSNGPVLAVAAALLMLGSGAVRVARRR